MLRALALVLLFISFPAFAQWGGQANVVNVINPQVLPPAGSPGLPAVDDNLAAGNYGLSQGVCAEWGHQVPCIQHYSITRASIKYCQTSDGVLFLVASGIGCLTNQGQSIEEARTNLILQSQTFGTTWVATSSSISSDVTTAPDGTTTADKLVEASGGTFHFVSQTVAKAASNLSYSLTLYAKQAGRTRIQMSANDSTGTNGVFAVFDLAGAQVGVAQATFGVGWTVGTSNVETLANGWVRTTMIVTSGAELSIQYKVLLDNGSGTGAASASYSGDGTSGTFLWGAQLEQSAFPTSYIPTTTTSATRAADAVAINNRASSVLNGTAGFIVTAFTMAQLPAIAAKMYDGTVANGMNIQAAGVANSSHGGTAPGFVATANSYTVSTLGKLGQSWDGVTTTGVLNGGTVASYATSNPADETYTLGNGATPNRAANGYLSRVTEGAGAPASATMQAITR